MTPRDRRALLIGALAVGGGWLLLRAGPAASRRWSESSERLAAHEVLLAETREAITALPRMEDSARALTVAVAHLAPRILSGGTEAIALSDLLGRLRLIAARHQVRFLSAGTAPDSTAAGQLHRVRATAILETDFRGLTDLLGAVARDSIVIVVERLRVTAPEPWADAIQPERLQVELLLAAWYLSEEPSS